MLEIYKKVSIDGGGGVGYYVPSSNQKLRKSHYAILVYSTGDIEVIKNRYENVKGLINIEYSVELFSKILANQKLKDTKLEMFKEGLSQLLQEAINKTLEGDYHENTVFVESGRDGSQCRRSP